MEFFIQKPAKDLGNKKVKLDSRETIHPEEVFLDNLAQKEEEESGLSEKKFEVLLSKRILQSFFLLCLFFISILFIKTFYFQIIQGGKFNLQAKENTERFYFERGDRGVIYDTNGKLLVSNIPSFDLVLDKRDLPQDIDKRLKVLEEVSKIIKKSPEELEKQIEESVSSIILMSENLDHETLLLLEPKIKDFFGFYIEKNTVRDYKQGSSFSHLLGFVGRIDQEEVENYKNYSYTDYIGKTGLEKSYEEKLRGKPGIIKIEKDALGKIRKEERISLPEVGKSLKLYLDSDLQKKAEEALKKSLFNIGSSKGVVVALDPKTGGVLSMVSIPSFNNNLFSQGISQTELDKINNNPLKPLFNRAIAGEYAVGSTIKPLMGVAGLEEDIITPKTKINDFQGEICVKNQWFPEKTDCFGDWKIHGIVDIYKAIAESCNVYFYTVGGGFEDFKGLGLEKIKKWLELFWWGSKTQIDLTGEKEGLIPDPDWKKENFNQEVEKIWYLGDTYNLSIGQGFIKVTPLQVATAFVAVANGGKIYQPQVAKEILDSEKNIIETIQPKILREGFADEENLEIIRKGMREGVEYGSSVILNSLPVRVAAKTGTAQTSKKGYFNSWVIVFAPFEEPEIVLTVLVEDVREGQVAALPVAKEVLEWYFAR